MEKKTETTIMSYIGEVLGYITVIMEKEMETASQGLGFVWLIKPLRSSALMSGSLL